MYPIDDDPTGSKLTIRCKVKLKWRIVECYEAIGVDGRIYRVTENWGPGNKYVAILAFNDKWGRLFSHVIGSYKNVHDAQQACEKDSKDDLVTRRLQDEDL